MNGRCVLAALALASACDRSHADTNIEAAAKSATDAGAAAIAAPLPSASAPAIARTSVTWHGSYKSAASELYVPPDWKNVHWNVKENGAGIGEGAIVVTVDPVNGRVLGTLEGPLGPAILDGLAADGKLTATIARRDPADQGFTGTLVGSLGDGGAEGTMNVSPAEANAVRTATFRLSADGVQAAPR